MMRALKWVAGILVCASAHAQGSAPSAPAPGSTIIYKHVDENGRVTYANSPIKGGARVDLEPITVIPSTPSGSLGQSQPPAVAQHAPLPIPVAPLPRESQAPIAAAPALAVPVARVVPSGLRAPNEKIAVKAAPRNDDNDADDSPRPLAMRPGVKGQVLSHSPSAPSASLPTWPAGDAAVTPSAPAKPVTSTAPETHSSVAASSPPQSAIQPIPSASAVRPLVLTASLSPEAAQKINEQRRADTRKRLLEGEMQTEEQLLSSAKLALTEEQRQTQSIRALRASFTASSDAGVQPPTKEQREMIERHFERVRNLQDQVSMHETHLKGLREQIASLK
jgi:hypothetical protein